MSYVQHVDEDEDLKKPSNQPPYQGGGYQPQPDAYAGYQSQPTPVPAYGYAPQAAAPYQPPPGQYQQPPYQQGAPYQAPPQQAGYGYPPQPAYGGPPTGFQEFHPPQEGDNGDGKFPEKTEYRDPIWGILFVVHLLAVIIILGVAANSSSGDATTNSSTGSYYSDSENDFLPWSDMGKVFLVCILGVVAAVGFAVVYLTILKKFAEQLIHLTLWAGIAWCLILAIIGFAKGAVWVGIIFLFCAAINGLFFYFWRKRIPFATAMLKTVAHILDTYPAPTYYAYVSLLVQFAWVLLWMPTFVLIQRYTSTGAAVLSIFLIFSFYWVSQVIKNVVHVTASGLVATWYFLSGVGMPPNPTQKAFKRATTTSFGSICLGSLVVAILKTLRQMLNSARNQNNALACVAACILGILDQLIEYFNMYAFTQVAIYGKTYCQAAKDTWTLVKSRGVDAIVNDNLISGVLILGAFLGGVATAVVGGIVALIAIPEWWLGLAFVCFLIGISLVMLTMEVVESGVATIFVCFAMDPQALQRNSPDLYNTFVATYHGLHV